MMQLALVEGITLTYRAWFQRPEFRLENLQGVKLAMDFFIPPFWCNVCHAVVALQQVDQV